LILFRLLHCIRHARGISLGGNHDGMNFLFFWLPDFTGKLKDEDVVKIQAFIQGTADAIRPKKN
jgi:hypothetical protein